MAKRTRKSRARSRAKVKDLPLGSTTRTVKGGLLSSSVPAGSAVTGLQGNSVLGKVGAVEPFRPKGVIGPCD